MTEQEKRLLEMLQDDKKKLKEIMERHGQKYFEYEVIKPKDDSSKGSKK